MLKRALDRDDDNEPDVSVVSNVATGTLTDGQRKLLAEVYVRIAQALPTEGRDYVVRVGFPARSESHGPNVTVKVTGITEIGKAFAKHVAAFLQKEVYNGRRG